MITAVAILNWNGVEHLKTFLPSVVKYSSKENHKIIIIDNGSTDESCSWVSSNYPDIQLIKLAKNHGFAGGYNEGLKQVEADRFVLLNSDVEVTEGWIENVNQTMNNLGLTVCSPQILDYSSPTNFEYAGAAGGYLDKDGYVFCAGRIFNSIETAEGNFTDDKEVFWASGAALFIDSMAWNNVGGLDPSFFAHMEEIDLCWRIKNRGQKVGACRSSQVFHLGGGTLSKSSSKKVYLNFRNNLLLLLKNESGFWPAFIFKRLILDGIAAIKFVTQLEFMNFLAVVKAHLVFYSMIPGCLKLRKLEKSARSACKPNTVGRFNSSILIEYFFKAKTKFSELDQSKFD